MSKTWMHAPAGTTTTEALKHLYKEGGVARYLIQEVSIHNVFVPIPNLQAPPQLRRSSTCTRRVAWFASIAAWAPRCCRCAQHLLLQHATAAGLVGTAE